MKRHKEGGSKQGTADLRIPFIPGSSFVDVGLKWRAMDGWKVEVCDEMAVKTSCDQITGPGVPPLTCEAGWAIQRLHSLVRAYVLSKV